MKTPLQKTILRWVIGIHATAIAVAIVIPLFQRILKPRKKEIITFVAIDNGSIPNPVPEIKPVEVESLPEPKAVEVPVQTNTPPKKVKKPEKPEPKPEPKPKPKPKWKAAPVVRQNNRITQDRKKPAPVTPQRKQITASDIRSALNTGGGGTVDPHGAYYSAVMQRMYGVWQVPVGAAYGLTAQASITVGTDGTVSNRQLTHRSGDSAFDQSVQKALNTVNRLPRPPADLPSRTIIIEFEPQ